METSNEFNNSFSRLEKIENFALLCRLCLQNHEELDDFFEAGMCDKIWEITHCKFDTSDDLMPRKMCKDCQKKVEEAYEFVCRIKFSEQHLKSLIRKRQMLCDKMKEELLSNVSLDKENELVVIVVPNSVAESSTAPENDNFYLKKINFDHTYPKGRTSLFDQTETAVGIDEDISGVCTIGETNGNGNGKGNRGPESGFYTCDRCNGFFEVASKFLSHFNICYGENPSSRERPSVLTCPMCPFCETNKNLYLKHLKIHENEGVTVFKFDPDCNELPMEISPPKDLERRLFKICFKGCKCEECGKYLTSFKNFVDHARECHDGTDFEKIEGKLGLVYMCPVCEKDGIEDETDFVEHLFRHKKRDDVDFVKVGISGNPVPLKQNEKKAFLNFKKTKNFEQIFGVDSKDQSIELTGASSGLGKCSAVEMVVPVAMLAAKSPRYDRGSCRSSFSTKKEMAEHLKLHTGDEEEEATFEGNMDFVCEKCGEKFIGSVSYEKHFLSEHAVEDRSRKKVKNRPTCDLCKKTFANRKRLGVHLKLHHKDENCENRIDSEDSKEGVVCEICGMRFLKNSGLSKHKKLHSIDRKNYSSPNKCKICERSFSNEKTRERHLAAHMNPNYFECDVCKLPLPSASALDRHSSNAHGGGNGNESFAAVTHDCKVCHLSFLSKDALTCHRARTGHVGGDSAPFECNVCHEKFYAGKNFARHIKLHPKYKTTECGLCGKRLSTFQSLALHMDRHYESNWILCSKCGKRFFEERNYRRHLLTHKGIRPYSCDVQGCQKSFYTLFEIKRHKKYHFDTRDFGCPYCTKKFHESNHLKVHIRTHTGEKPYVCPHCHKGFVTRTRCKQHIKLIHQGVGYDLIRSEISKKVAVFEANK